MERQIGKKKTAGGTSDELPGECERSKKKERETEREKKKKEGAQGERERKERRVEMAGSQACGFSYSLIQAKTEKDRETERASEGERQN